MNNTCDILTEAMRVVREEGILPFVRQLPRAVYARTIPLEHRISIRLQLQRVQGYTALDDPLEPLYVDPERIEYRSESRYLPEEHNLGRIVDGDWDKRRTELEQTVTYRGLYDRFVADCPWEETAYYEHAKNTIEEEGEYLGYTCVKEFLESRCTFVDNLYDSLQGGGYQSTGDARPVDHRRPWSSKDPTEISVVIDRNGEMLLHDGHHRLILARFLGFSEVPIHVLVRHEKWQQQREALVSGMGTGPVNASHPDLKQLFD